IEVKAGSGTLMEQVVEQEGERILAALEPSDSVHILDERGQQCTSPEFSALLAQLEMRAVKRMVLAVGGAYGLSDAVRKRGKMLSLSKLTLPHELCRALLLEQLYRARSIQHGEPYHHA